MSTTYKVLTSDADLLTAALAQVKVYVGRISDDEPNVIVDYSGPIQKYTPDFVKVADIYYKREEFEFRVHLPKK